jgi:hypothetical protein
MKPHWMSSTGWLVTVAWLALFVSSSFSFAENSGDLFEALPSVGGNVEDLKSLGQEGAEGAIVPLDVPSQNLITSSFRRSLLVGSPVGESDLDGQLTGAPVPVSAGTPLSEEVCKHDGNGSGQNTDNGNKDSSVHDGIPVGDVPALIFISIVVSVGVSLLGSALMTRRRF